MSESIQLQEPVFKLVVRFANGEVFTYVVREPLEARLITPDLRYAVVTSILLNNPSECTDVTVINLRDVSFIKTERVTLEQLASERRMAGIRSAAGGHADERMPKSVSQVKFI